MVLTSIFLADKSTSFWKKLLGMDQEDHRSSILLKATQNSQGDVVRLLASRADQVAKSQALQTVIRLNNATNAIVLPNSGADAAEFHNEFRSAIESRAEDMVGLLTCASRGPCLQCRTRGLIKAVETGST